jgi:septal ring factor EnvC (AmiA/AmiB activator)
MFIISPFVVLCSSLVLFVLIIAYIYRQKVDLQRVNKRLQTQVDAQELLLIELQSSKEDINKQLAKLERNFKSQSIENEQVSKQLEHRIKALQQDNISQKELVVQIQNQQPQDKLYSRAFKLVELGADIEEVVRECDIPLAEAEMLISVHRNKTNPS